MKMIQLFPGSVYSQDAGGLDGHKNVQRRVSSKSEIISAAWQIFTNGCHTWLMLIKILNVPAAHWQKPVCLFFCLLSQKYLKDYYFDNAKTANFWASLANVRFNFSLSERKQLSIFAKMSTCCSQLWLNVWTVAFSCSGEWVAGCRGNGYVDQTDGLSCAEPHCLRDECQAKPKAFPPGS